MDNLDTYKTDFFLDFKPSDEASAAVKDMKIDFEFNYKG